MSVSFVDVNASCEFYSFFFHQESFFGVSAEDASANQEAQNSICQIMDSLCPPGGNVGMSVKPIHST